MTNSMFPSLKTPSIPLTLPTPEKEEIVLRQLSTSDYKNIMSAVNTSNVAIFLETIQEVIEGAVIKPTNFKIDNYPSAIVDWLYLNIYSMSINGAIEIALNCSNPVKKTKNIQELDPETGLPIDKTVEVVEACGSHFSLPVAISEVTLTDKPEKDVFEIEADNGSIVYIKLKLPNWKIYHKMVERLSLTVNDISDRDEEKESVDKELRAMYSAIFDCLDSIFVGDIPLDLSNAVFEEFCDWLDTFPPQKIMEMKDFITGIPQPYYKQDIQCPSCGFKQTFRMIGLKDFLK